MVLFLLLLSVTAFSEDIKIKSLRTYPAGKESTFPLIIFDEENSGIITIEFDVQSNSVPDLHIIFKFCDRNWMPVNNAFLANNGKNTAFILDYNSLPVTVEDAHYHFKNSYPDEQGYVDFPFSGKWMYFITDAFDTSIIYGSGRFYVVYSEVSLSTVIKNEQLEDKTYFPSDLAKVFNVTTELNLPDELFPNFVNGVEIVENRRIADPVLVGKDFNTNTRQFYWDGNRRFTFTARDIRPGNGYRSADFRNTNKFGSKSIRAQFDGLENSRFYKSPSNDLNGGSVLTKYDDPNSTYLDVNFSIRPPDEVSGNIFLTGAFNNWELLPEYELDNKAGVYSSNILLKRGIYDYQYVVADVINNEIKNADWYVLEGNNWETSNEYHIFLYYTSQEYGGYDKIIGYSNLKSR
jgi:hypothetical protein